MAKNFAAAKFSPRVRGEFAEQFVSWKFAFRINSDVVISSTNVSDTPCCSTVTTTTNEDDDKDEDGDNDS